MKVNRHEKSLCPRCRAYPVEYRVLAVTGDIYGYCANYPECTYVTHFLEQDMDRKVPHSA
jgi:ssDNA-binding Zn-finger/Zn-ribbon topoisomerase 1